MEKERCIRELERAIFNWHYAGIHASPVPVFNAIRAWMDQDMDMLVPVVPGTTSALQKQAVHSPLPEETVTYRRWYADEAGSYYIPVYTSEAQLNEARLNDARLSGERLSGKRLSEELPHQEANEKDQYTFIRKSLKELMREAETSPNCVGLIVNPGNRKLVLTRKMIRTVTEHRPKSHFSLVKGSVVDMHVGAIVNAANISLLGGGGVDGAIHRAAGPKLLEECRTLNGCKTGEAKITGAYNIRHADRIIHTVGPIYSGKEEDARLLASCYRRSLDLALQHGLASIAFPGISTGAYGYPLREAATIALRTVSQWLDAHPDVVMNVYLCCFRDEEMEVYTELIRTLFAERGSEGEEAAGSLPSGPGGDGRS